ncbi:mammalian cell entry protein [Mycolicibacterium pulveris]|uniref:mammalian cell entry protein n=1 Tax=Mycolicibacterium pulveris TaxID=36813 RepID=UPI003CF9B2A2
MEDQPADSGDLTAAEDPQAAEPSAPAGRRRWFSLRRRPKAAGAEDVPAQEESVEPEPPKPVPRGKAARTNKPAAPVDDAPETEVYADEDPEVPEKAEEQPVLVAHRPAGRRLAVAVIVAAVLFVGAAGFAAAMVQPYLSERATVKIKLDVARTAADAITTLWTYTPDDMESLPDRSAGYLGGDFEHEYRKYIDAIVAPNKQAQVSNTTQVMGAAVETLTPTEATAIVYTNSVATSPVTKNIPSLRYLSYRLTMKRDDAKWLITRMSTVTSLDLTPQL